MHPATLVIGAAYALLANAQFTQNIPRGTESITPFQATQANCLAQCHIADTACRAKCINVHNPSGDPILAVQHCQANCIQGDGSVEQTASYGVCLQDCINLDESVSALGGGAPAVTNSAVASSTTGSAATATVAATGPTSSSVEPATTIGSSTLSRASSTGSFGSVTASAIATSNAAEDIHVKLAVLSYFGLLAAFAM